MEIIYTKNPINANPMIAKPHFEKTNKCKMQFYLEIFFVKIFSKFTKK
jgi:hypothetical protein